MNKYISFIITILSLILYSSCTKKEKIVEIDNKSQFEERATLHNEAMDFILKSLKRAKIDKPSDFVHHVNEQSEVFLQSMNESIGSINDSQLALKNEVDKLKSFRSSDNLKSGYSKEDYLRYTIDFHAHRLSSHQLKLLSRIDNILDNYKSIDKILSELQYIKDIECMKLPSSERDVIYAATTIGIESIKYWTKNSDDWMNALRLVLKPEELKSVSGWFNWSSVGKSDIAGAIGGALGGAMVGAVAGGAGAVPAALAGFVGGGIGTSATDAIFQCLDRLLW